MNQFQFLIDGPVHDSAVYTFQNVVGGIIDLIRIVVTGVCLIMLTVLAIKYFSNTPTIKNESKNALPDYIIGIVIFLGIANFLPFIADLIGAVLNQL